MQFGCRGTQQGIHAVYDNECNVPGPDSDYRENRGLFPAERRRLQRRAVTPANVRLNKHSFSVAPVLALHKYTAVGVVFVPPPSHTSIASLSFRLSVLLSGP